MVRLCSGRICLACGQLGRPETCLTTWGHTWASSSTHQHCWHSLPLLGLWFWPEKLCPSPRLPCWYLGKACSVSRSQLSHHSLTASLTVHFPWFSGSPFLVNTYHTGSLPSSMWQFCFFSFLFFSFFLYSNSPFLSSFLPFFPSPRLRAHEEGLESTLLTKPSTVLGASWKL